MLCASLSGWFDHFRGRRHHVECRPARARHSCLGPSMTPLHQPNQCSALLENWHTGSRTVSGAAHQASWPGATPFEDYIRPREATQHYCSSTCFQATPSNRPGVVRMRHKSANAQTRRSSICPENFGPCLCCVWPPQPCKVTPYHMFQTPNGPQSTCGVVDQH